MTELDNNYAMNDNSYVEENSNNGKGKFEIPLWRQLGVFAMGWLGIKILASLISIIAGFFIDRNSIPNPNENIEAYENFVNSINAKLEFAIYFLLLVSLLVILGKKLIIFIFKDVKQVNKIGKGLLFGVIVIASQVFINLLITTFRGSQPDVNENETAVRSIISLQPFYSFFFVVLFAPICEEITYRFGLCGSLSRINKWVGICVSALLFGLIHTAFFDVSTFTEGLSQETIINELINLPSYIVCGLIFGYAYKSEDCLVTSITAHITNNLLAFLSSMATGGIVLHGVNFF